MREIRVAVVGAGFIGPVHVEGLRRAGVSVTGILDITPEKLRQAADRLGLEQAYGTFEQVIGDPQVQAVHITTPNRHHFTMASAALRAGKHVMCEKPLAMDLRESAELVDRHRTADWQPELITTFASIRSAWMPLSCAHGDVGDIFHIAGSYAQDWLLHPTDYNWRVLGDEGGELRAVADIGTHWLDLTHSITGLEVEAVCSALKTVHPIRQRPKGEVETFQSKNSKPKRRKRFPSTSTPKTAAAILLRIGKTWFDRHPPRLPSERRAQELPPHRNQRRQRIVRLEQRIAQRPLDRSSRQAERVARSGSGITLAARPHRSPTTPAATTKVFQIPSSKVFGRSTAISRPVISPRPQAVPDLHRRPPRDSAL